MSVERPEIASFIASSKHTPLEQFAQELASYSLETKRIPDPYYFTVNKSGELFSPTARCLVKDKVEDKTGSIGRPEYEALLFIEKWAARESDGAIVWVSPPAPHIYPISKIIVSEIQQQNGEKILFNRAILLPYSGRECLEFAAKLIKFSSSAKASFNTDQLRANPIALQTKGQDWINILEQLINDPRLWESIRKGVDTKAKKEAVRRAVIVRNEIFNAKRPLDMDHAVMTIMQMMGSGSASCPAAITNKRTGAFTVFAGSSASFITSSFAESDSMGSLYFPCPVCGVVNKRPREGFVENCQSCGTDKVSCKSGGTSAVKQEIAS